MKKVHFRLTCVVQKRLCLSSQIADQCVSRHDPRTLCESSIGPVSLSFLKWRILLLSATQRPSSETQGQSVGSGEKARRKFSSTGERAPGYRLSPDHFQKFKRMLAPDWAQKMLCIIVPNRRTHLLSSFRVFVNDGYCFHHGFSGSCTKEMHAIRKLSV